VKEWSVAKRAAWLTVYAIAMGLVEAAVVIYLRALHPGQVVLSQVLGALPAQIVTIEVVREAATLVMLVAVAVLASRERREILWHFLLAFAVWDLAYYGWLWVFIGWPPSLFTWDVLFLIPVPWVAPVLAPVIISLLLAAMAVWMVRGRRSLAHPRRAWLGGAVGSAVILWSFTLHYQDVVAGAFPSTYPWGVFWAGVVIGAGSFFYQIRAVRSR
jgi:hypothetical protein